MSDGMDVLLTSPILTVTMTAIFGRSLINMAFLISASGEIDMEFLGLEASTWALMVVIPTLLAWVFLTLRYNSDYTAWKRSKVEKDNMAMQKWIDGGCEGEKPVATDLAYGKEYKLSLFACVFAGLVVSVLFTPVVGYIVEGIVTIPEPFDVLLYVGIAIVLTLWASIYLDVKVAHGVADGTGDEKYIEKGKLLAQTLEDTASGILADKRAGNPQNTTVDMESFKAWMMSSPLFNAPAEKKE